MKNKNISTAQDRYKIVLSLLLAIAVLFVIPKDTFAASISLGTAPTSEKLNLTQGQKYNGELVVWNLSEKATTYQIVIKGFRQIENQPGTAIILTDDEEKRVSYSASTWLKTDQEEITLVPNRNEKIFYEINVPKDATKGEYNVEIAFISKNDSTEQGTAAFTTLSSGMPILIKVGNEFVENAELLKFETDKNWYEYPSLTFLTRIKNLGDTHIAPVGEIILTNFLDQEIARIPFNPNGQSVLRDNTGNYSTIWDFEQFLTKENKLVIGPVDAKLIVTYRSFQPGFSPLTADLRFWIIPWKYILAILLAIISIVVIVSISKKKKRHALPK